jgi:hypothetical protein
MYRSFCTHIYSCWRSVAIVEDCSVAVVGSALTKTPSRVSAVALLSTSDSEDIKGSDEVRLAARLAEENQAGSASLEFVEGGALFNIPSRSVRWIYR